MPLAFLLIFGGALLVYMGWKNESLPGILQDTLSPISGSVQDPNAPGGVVDSLVGQAPLAATPSYPSGNPLFTNPLAPGHYFKGWSVGRTDQGVDFSGVAAGTPIGAIGTSRVIGIQSNWWQGQPFVWLQALDGPLKGRYYYVAEQITNIAKPGTTLLNGQPIGYYASSGTGIEAGLATAGGSTLARATTGYPTDGTVTPAGTLFKQLIGLG